LGYGYFWDATDDGHDASAHVPRSELFYDYVLGGALSLRLAISVSAAFMQDGALVAAGPKLGVLVRPRPLVVGLTLAPGYQFGSDPATGPEPSFFLEPEIIVGVRVSSRVEAGMRSGPWLSNVRDRGQSELGIAWLTTGLWFAYHFGGECRYGDCDEPLEARPSAAIRRAIAVGAR
jgi:hypothetical protein